MWYTTDTYILIENNGVHSFYKRITENVFCSKGIEPSTKIRNRYKQHGMLVHVTVMDLQKTKPLINF